MVGRYQSHATSLKTVQKTQSIIILLQVVARVHIYEKYHFQQQSLKMQKISNQIWKMLLKKYKRQQRNLYVFFCFFFLCFFCLYYICIYLVFSCLFVFCLLFLGMCVTVLHCQVTTYFTDNCTTMSRARQD